MKFSVTIMSVEMKELFGSDVTSKAKWRGNAKGRRASELKKVECIGMFERRDGETMRT